MIGSWKAYIYDKNDVFVAELPFEGLTTYFELNAVSKATVRVNYHIFKDWMTKQGTTVENAISAGYRWVEIKRNTTIIFKGILTEASIQKFEMDINLTLTFKGWLSYFERRFITKSYTGTDAGAIAWDLINTAQAETYGSIGITQGTINATVNRDRTYSNDEITKSLIHLSNSQIINGFEFEITNSKVLTVKSRLGSDKPYLVFDKGNIKSWQADYKLSLLLTNKVKVLGEGIGDAQLTTTRQSTNTYPDKWYLLEDNISFLSVSEEATLQAHGDNYLDLNQDSSITFKITTIPNNIEPTEYDVGDAVMVHIEDIIDDLYRIKSKEINVNNGEEEIKLEFLFN